jgi:hypothetical protein
VWSVHGSCRVGMTWCMVQAEVPTKKVQDLQPALSTVMEVMPPGTVVLASVIMGSRAFGLTFDNPGLATMMPSVPLPPPMMRLPREHSQLAVTPSKIRCLPAGPRS